MEWLKSLHSHVHTQDSVSVAFVFYGDQQGESRGFHFWGLRRFGHRWRGLGPSPVLSTSLGCYARPAPCPPTLPTELRQDPALRYLMDPVLDSPVVTLASPSL